jgi:SAM-dependent methyltransferase
MERTTVTIPIYLPRWLVRPLRAARNTLKLALEKRHPTVNLVGDRDVEWSWIASQMPVGPGEALDFGPGGSYLGLVAAHRGFDVTSVDLQPPQWPYIHTKLSFIRGDLLRLPLPKGKFDLVINCSTVEHVGLTGRYGVTESLPDGDMRAMTLLRNLMKPGGIMLLTVPVGRDAVFAPLCRVYGRERLPRLLDGYIVAKETFWIKDSENRWSPSDREAAFAFEASVGSWDPLRNVYALGCFMLRTPQAEGRGGVQMDKVAFGRLQTRGPRC